MSKNIKLTSIVLIVLVSFFVLLKGLDKPNTYSPELSTTKIDFNFKAKDLFSDEEIFLDDLIKNDVIFVASGVTDGTLLKGVKKIKILFLKNSQNKL